MNTLFAKLSMVLVVVVGTMGTGVHFAESFYARLYCEELAGGSGESEAHTTSAMAIGAISVAAALLGLLLFWLLTRRLRLISREVHRAGDFEFETVPAAAEPKSAGDEIDALRVAFLDMSTRIKERLEQLKEKDDFLREFVSNISHDLRTPLSAVEGYLESLIVKGDVSLDEQRRYLRNAQRHTVRLRTLISEMLELSKLEEVGMSLNLEEFSLAELVQDTAMEFQVDAGKKDIDLSIEVGSSANFTLADIGLIQRVLENLIGNAIRFSPRGGKVSVFILERNDSVAVAVADSGPGIPDEYLPRIFDRFFRVAIEDEADCDSFGLGLAIVKKILDLHGIPIAVSSVVGAGTRFEFELPLGNAGEVK